MNNSRKRISINYYTVEDDDLAGTPEGLTIVLKIIQENSEYKELPGYILSLTDTAIVYSVSKPQEGDIAKCIKSGGGFTGIYLYWFRVNKNLAVSSSGPDTFAYGDYDTFGYIMKKISEKPIDFFDRIKSGDFIDTSRLKNFVETNTPTFSIVYKPREILFRNGLARAKVNVVCRGRIFGEDHRFQQF